MAQSIHTIIKTGKFEVKHQHEEVMLNIPQYLIINSDVMMDEDKLLQWAMDNEILHGLLHKGIKQLIIDLRATARPQVKLYSSPDKIKEREEDGFRIDKTKCEVTRSIIKDADKAQDRIDNYIIKPLPIPGTTTNVKVTKAIEDKMLEIVANMKKAGMNDEQIKIALGK